MSSHFEAAANTTPGADAPRSTRVTVRKPAESSSPWISSVVTERVYGRGKVMLLVLGSKGQHKSPAILENSPHLQHLLHRCLPEVDGVDRKGSVEEVVREGRCGPPPNRRSARPRSSSACCAASPSRPCSASNPRRQRARRGLATFAEQESRRHTEKDEYREELIQGPDLGRSRPIQACASHFA